MYETIRNTKRIVLLFSAGFPCIYTASITRKLQEMETAVMQSFDVLNLKIREVNGKTKYFLCIRERYIQQENHKRSFNYDLYIRKASLHRLL